MKSAVILGLACLLVVLLHHSADAVCVYLCLSSVVYKRTEMSDPRQDVVVGDDVGPSRVLTLTIPRDVIVFPVPASGAMSVSADAVQEAVDFGTRKNVSPVNHGKVAVVADADKIHSNLTMYNICLL
ncbi:hypothetical protein LOTGIDRAFT_232649 [Lottia gigantea]|uniref:Uncharacterized protein n=1 Tax=Lottia gigantea TaxID=225164 RepID=V4AEN5_LOTGI|nr:hypothetical protein LOTGIDRAFT_232649 [Lottia gigantea]ESO93610.1 hypothetical protein LOTGIDRAFT_232649 [Lottia gigantea]